MIYKVTQDGKIDNAFIYELFKYKAFHLHTDYGGISEATYNINTTRVFILECDNDEATYLGLKYKVQVSPLPQLEIDYLRKDGYLPENW